MYAAHCSNIEAFKELLQIILSIAYIGVAERVKGLNPTWFLEFELTPPLGRPFGNFIPRCFFHWVQGWSYPLTLALLLIPLTKIFKILGVRFDFPPWKKPVTPMIAQHYSVCSGYLSIVTVSKFVLRSFGWQRRSEQDVQSCFWVKKQNLFPKTYIPKFCKQNPKDLEVFQFRKWNQNIGNWTKGLFSWVHFKDFIFQFWKCFWARIALAPRAVSRRRVSGKVYLVKWKTLLISFLKAYSFSIQVLFCNSFIPKWACQ